MNRKFEFADGSTVDVRPGAEGRDAGGVGGTYRDAIVVRVWGTTNSDGARFAAQLADMLEQIAGSTLITPAPLDAGA